MAHSDLAAVLILTVALCALPGWHALILQKCGRVWAGATLWCLVLAILLKFVEISCVAVAGVVGVFTHD